MDQLQLKELKEEYSKFLMLYNELNRAKNQKDRNRIDKELDFLKSRMISEFELRQHDNYVAHYSHDNHYFKGDVETIIYKLENEDSNS